MHKKRPKICTCCRVSEGKIYLYHRSKIAKAGPGYDVWPEHPPVQISSSSPWPKWKQTNFRKKCGRILKVKLIFNRKSPDLPMCPHQYNMFEILFEGVFLFVHTYIVFGITCIFPTCFCILHMYFHSINHRELEQMEAKRNLQAQLKS